MPHALPFSEEHRDCLQEICNIAMGAAGESLANFANVFVNLSIPKIRYIDPNQIKEALVSLEGSDKVSAVVQRFHIDSQQAFALVVITEPSFNDLAASAGRELSCEREAEQLLRDLSHTINNTCLPRLAEMMESSFGCDNPQVLSLHVPLDELSLQDIAGWDHVISVEINYHLENHPFNCDLLLLLPDNMVGQLVDALESLLND